MKNYFQRSKEQPYHISVGAVLTNDKNEVCVQYLKDFYHPAIDSLSDFYSLMRETIEPNETIEQALHRGLLEEFGAVAELKSFLGSIVAMTPQEDYFFQKNTLYFHFKLVSLDPSKRSTEDKKINAEIVWKQIPEAVAKMKEQGKRLNREDLDESIVLERLIKSQE